MDPGWRLLQIDHDKRARKILEEGGRRSGARFWDWEAVLWFYAIVIAVDGYAEMRGIPTPKSHRARRAVVKRYFPHLLEWYDGLYGLSLEARYYNGYVMSDDEGHRAETCHGILSQNIPVQ